MANKGVIVFRGDSGNPESHYAKTQVSDVTDAAALDTLATALGAYTDANIAKKSFSALVIGTDTAPGAAANVDAKGVVYFRDPTSLRVHSVTIPAIKSTAWEVKPQGDRITAVAGAAIVAAINAATGKSYVFLYGVALKKR